MVSTIWGFMGRTGGCPAVTRASSQEAHRFAGSMLAGPGLVRGVRSSAVRVIRWIRAGAVRVCDVAGLRSAGSWRRRSVAGGALLVAVALGAWALWPAGSSGSTVFPASRERAYTNFTACLLTGPAGIAGVDAAPVWAGLERASAASKVQVRSLAVIGSDTAANAASYLDTLALSKCDLVVAAGNAEVAALGTQAKTFPGVHFLAVGVVPGASNVAAGSAAAVTASVSGAVQAASAGKFSGSAVS